VNPVRCDSHACLAMAWSWLYGLLAWLWPNKETKRKGSLAQYKRKDATKQKKQLFGSVMVQSQVARLLSYGLGMVQSQVARLVSHSLGTGS